MNPLQFDRVDDIVDLTLLNEASDVHNHHSRYGSGAIYVSMAPILRPYPSVLAIPLPHSSIF